MKYGGGPCSRVISGAGRVGCRARSGRTGLAGKGVGTVQSSLLLARVRHPADTPEQRTLRTVTVTGRHGHRSPTYCPTVRVSRSVGDLDE